MGMKSKENGDKGENAVKNFFRSMGYWAHVTKKGNGGTQPVDIIAIKNKDNWLVDAKYVNRNCVGRFSFDDIQANQVESLQYAHDFAGIENVGFVIVFEDYGRGETMKFFPLDTYLSMKKMGWKSVHDIDLKDLRSYLP